MTESLCLLPDSFFNRDRVWRLLTSLFLIGIVIGALFGAFSKMESVHSAPETFLRELETSGYYTESIVMNLVFLLLLFFSATSFLGIFLIPAIVLIKAFFLSRVLALFYSIFGFDGQVFSLIVIAIPAALFLLGFILCAVCSYRSSVRLLSLRFRTVSYHVEPGLIGKAFFIALLCILFFVLYQCFLLPQIVAKMY